MGSRTWIKIYCDKWLNGTIREETPELRGIWVDLLVLAGSGRYGDSGEIKITDQVGYLDQQLADLLQISVQKWVACKKKLVETDRVEVSEKNVLRIKNWGKYQSEYERQKPYRERESTFESGQNGCNKKLQQEVTGQAVTKSATGDRDRDMRSENREGDTTNPLPPSAGVVVNPSVEKTLNYYQEKICLPGTIMRAETKAQLLEACEIYTPESVYDAINEACAQNQRTWPYIASILRNRQRAEDMAGLQASREPTESQ